MTPADAQTILFAIDAGTETLSRLHELAKKARAEGLITVEEQQARADKLEALRTKYKALAE